MLSLRFASAVLLSIDLVLFALPALSVPPMPIGILTQATGAYLDGADASVGLSVFEGERLQTAPGGRASLRMGKSSFVLVGNSEAALVRIDGGIHVDLTSGTMRFSVNEVQLCEVHAEEAMIRSKAGRATEAIVSILEPKVLQIDARRGSLDFSYREEFRNLPQGQVYRIYLDSPTESEISKTSSGKAAYYIVGAGAAGGITWLTYEAIHSGNSPISPSRP